MYKSHMIKETCTWVIWRIQETCTRVMWVMYKGRIVRVKSCEKVKSCERRKISLEIKRHVQESYRATECLKETCTRVIWRIKETCTRVISCDWLPQGAAPLPRFNIPGFFFPWTNYVETIIHITITEHYKRALDKQLNRGNLPTFAGIHSNLE